MQAPYILYHSEYGTYTAWEHLLPLLYLIYSLSDNLLLNTVVVCPDGIETAESFLSRQKHELIWKVLLKRMN